MADLKTMLEDPVGWTDCSCECLAHMALEEIEHLEQSRDFWKQKTYAYINKYGPLDEDI